MPRVTLEGPNDNSSLMHRLRCSRSASHVTVVGSDGIQLTAVLANADSEPSLQGMAQHRVCKGREITFGKLVYVYSSGVYQTITHLHPPLF